MAENKMKQALSRKKERTLADKGNRAGQVMEKIHSEKQEIKTSTSLLLPVHTKEAFDFAVLKLKSLSGHRKEINKTTVITKLLELFSEEIENNGLESPVIQNILKGLF